MSDVQYLQAQGLWEPIDCGGTPCTTTSVPSLIDISFNWSGAGTDRLGFSAQRVNQTGKSREAWVMMSGSFGLLLF